MQKGGYSFKVDVIRLWILVFLKLHSTISYDHIASVFRVGVGKLKRRTLL
jgi:hypothetical protein